MKSLTLVASLLLSSMVYAQGSFESEIQNFEVVQTLKKSLESTYNVTCSETKVLSVASDVTPVWGRAFEAEFSCSNDVGHYGVSVRFKGFGGLYFPFQVTEIKMQVAG